MRGAKVRDLVVNSQSPTANSLVWDGHDSNGAVVPSGVYLYKIQSGKETKTGTVVVAR
jgi:flagellar hook assembly protein FlgD